MIIRRIIVGFLLLLGLPAAAGTLQLPILKAGPITYTNVTVIGANSTDLYFQYDQGIGNVKLKYLSPELQKRFHYDPAKAAEAEQQQAQADVRYKSTVASNIADRVQQVRAALARRNAPRQNLLDPVSDKSLLGKAAPRFAKNQWVGDPPDLEGKYLLVAFWEPWSAASKQALTALGALQKQFAKQLVAVAVSTNSAAALEKIEAGKPGLPLATDPDGKMRAAAGVTSIPSVLLVDPNGIVRYQGHPAALTQKSLNTLLAAPE